MVGEAIAMDLAQEAGWTVTVADRDGAALQRLAARYGVRTHEADLSDAAAITALCAPHDIVVGALSSHLGLATLGAVIDAGRDYVDISFMAQDPAVFDARARDQGVTAVVDCGVGPGLSNMIVGWATVAMAPCRRIEIYVGGLPAERRWPYEYKAAFAPADVIEEYVRPARIVEGGNVVVRPALSEPELIDFPEVGTLEAFNTDGLRSLAGLDVPDIVEKTMRYPGHIELMRVLRDLGLFSETPIEVGGQSIVPRDVTSALLFPQWTYAEGEVDLTIMRIVVHGEQDGRAVRRQWDLLDRRDASTGLRSMSRTTGFPAAIMARQIASGRFRRPGVHAPEVYGATDGMLDEMLAALSRRGITFQTHSHADG
jgi:saccharopine dehydrogenase-like NADP-dependent oxidoreductase